MSFFSKFFGAGRYERAPASRDFRPEDLPDTRVKLFFDALGIRWSAMVGQNLFYLLFWLPAILWSGVNLLTLVQMLADAPAGADMGARVYSLAFTYLLILWPLIAITGPATAGASYVSRNWARGQHSFMVSDFMEHARKNWKQALAVSTVTGALPVLLLFLWRFYGALAESMSGLFIIPEVIVFIAAILWLFDAAGGVHDDGHLQIDAAAAAGQRHAHGAGQIAAVSGRAAVDGGPAAGDG